MKLLPRESPLKNRDLGYVNFIPHVLKNEVFLVPKYVLPKQKYYAIEVLDQELIDSSTTFLFAGGDPSLMAILMSSFFPIWVDRLGGEEIEREVHINNFPFPEISKKEAKELLEASSRVFAVRQGISGQMLSDLYKKGEMRENLIMAHEELDRIVSKIYGLPKDASNEEIADFLIKEYQSQLLENA